MARARDKPVVLLVEDHATTRAALGRRLQKIGYSVKACDSMQAALKEFRAGYVDIVVADWDLAARDAEKGDALFNAIRKRDWEVPLLLVSGKLTEDKQRASTLARVLRNGASGFVERGGGYGTITAAIRDLLGRRDIALAEAIRRLRGVSASIPTTSGPVDASKVLSRLLSDVRLKSSTIGPLAKEFGEWEAARRGRTRRS